MECIYNYTHTHTYIYVYIYIHIYIYCVWFFFSWGTVWSLNSRLLLAKQALYRLSHTSCPFSSGYFGDGVSQTICPGQPWTMILLISVFQVPRISGMSHWCPAMCLLFAPRVKIAGDFYIFVWIFIYIFNFCTMNSKLSI
jgi:hypothetical protein